MHSRGFRARDVLHYGAADKNLVVNRRMGVVGMFRRQAAVHEVFDVADGILC